MSFRWAALLMLGVMATVTAAAGLKVDKNAIEVSAPDGHGVVQVQGQPQAVRSEHPAQLEIEHVVVHEVPLARDGSFQTRLNAATGDKLVVRATDEFQRSSRATLEVPAGTKESLPLLYRPAPQDFTIVLTVIDNRTNDVYLQRDVTGSAADTERAEAWLNRMARDWVRQTHEQLSQLHDTAGTTNHDNITTREDTTDPNGLSLEIDTEETEQL